MVGGRSILAVGAVLVQPSGVSGDFACAPHCDARLADVVPPPRGAWKTWRTPFGGIEVAYLERDDVSHGGGADFGLDLVRYLHNRLDANPKRCFEFCAGPAFIGFAALGAGVCSTLVVADINPVSVSAARETVRLNGLEGLVDVYHSDGLDQVPNSELGQWDLVFANPPHFASVEAWFGDDAETRGVAPSAFWSNVMIVDAEWNLHKRFYADVLPFLKPGNGQIVLQENCNGSRPRDMLPLLGTQLQIERIELQDARLFGNRGNPFKYWYMHTTNDEDAWTRVSANTPRPCGLEWRGSSLALVNDRGESCADVMEASMSPAALEKRRAATRLPLEARIAKIADALAVEGYATDGGGIADAATLGDLRSKLVQRLQKTTICRSDFGIPRNGCGATLEAGAGVNATSYRIWGLLDANVPGGVSATVAPLAAHPLLRAVVRRFLGGDAQLHGCTAYVAMPGSTTQNVFHYDFEKQDSDVRLGDAPRTKPDFLAAMLFLQDADAESGATVLLPKSHLWPRLQPPFLPPGQMKDFEDVRRAWNETYGEFRGLAEPVSAHLEAGALLFFDGGTMHATGAYAGPLGAVEDALEQARYAIVFHFASQRRSSKWGKSELGAAYLGGHARLELNLRIGEKDDSVVFHPDDDLAAVARAFVSDRVAAVEIDVAADTLDFHLRDAVIQHRATLLGPRGET
ncbi:hypothetical protein M885DRAFT_515212 [Pelagophyceae sp. CCMP2097]|nr:hypothetical protein M885DRAFT_515212 [Pelagophyceae sp. CCMP2097]